MMVMDEPGSMSTSSPATKVSVLPVKTRSVAGLMARAVPLNRIVPVEVAEKTLGDCTGAGTVSVSETSRAVVSVSAFPFAMTI